MLGRIHLLKEISIEGIKFLGGSLLQSALQPKFGCREWLLKRGVAIVVGELPPPLLLIPRTAAQQYRCSSVFP